MEVFCQAYLTTQRTKTDPLGSLSITKPNKTCFTKVTPGVFFCRKAAVLCDGVAYSVQALALSCDRGPQDVFRIFGLADTRSYLPVQARLRTRTFLT